MSASSSASAADADVVSPELKEIGEKYVALSDQVVAIVDKAQEAGSYEAVEDEWNEVSGTIDDLSDEAREWATKYSNGELSDADKEYYDEVVLPAALACANAAMSMLDLIKI